MSCITIKWAIAAMSELPVMIISVSAGFRLQIYSRLSAKVGKTFTRFQVNSSKRVNLKIFNYLSRTNVTQRYGGETALYFAQVPKRELFESLTRVELPKLQSVNFKPILDHVKFRDLHQMEQAF